MPGSLFCPENRCSMFLRNVGKYLLDCVGFEILTAGVMKISVIWDVVEELDYS
jgi:hypothetical protein